MTRKYNLPLMTAFVPLSNDIVVPQKRLPPSFVSFIIVDGTTDIGKCVPCGEGYQCADGTSEFGTEGEPSRVPCNPGDWTAEDGVKYFCSVAGCHH